MAIMPTACNPHVSPAPTQQAPFRLARPPKHTVPLALLPPPLLHLGPQVPLGQRRALGGRLVAHVQVGGAHPGAELLLGRQAHARLALHHRRALDAGQLAQQGLVVLHFRQLWRLPLSLCCCCWRRLLLHRRRGLPVLQVLQLVRAQVWQNPAAHAGRRRRERRCARHGSADGSRHCSSSGSACTAASGSAWRTPGAAAPPPARPPAPWPCGRRSWRTSRPSAATP